MPPRREGITDTRRVYGDEAAGPPLLKLRCGASLADLQTDYALFTYAPLFLFGGLEHNPVQEWINRNNHKQIVFILPLNAPFIRMGADPRWDRTLWLVEKPYWQSLSLHIGSMALLNRRQKRLTRAICQELPVPDVVALEHLTTVDRVPKVTISTFSVDSNLGCLAFAPGSVLTQNRPHLKFHPARDETVKLATALLACNTNPYHGIQDPPWETPSENSNPPAASV